MLVASVGIFAHNEQATIGSVVEAFLEQDLSPGSMVIEVVVVCCGCTDDTVPIVRAVMERDARLRLLVRGQREGKVAAINAFLNVAKAEVAVLASGDVLPARDAVDRLIRPFATDERCLMTGPRVLPTAHREGHSVVDTLHELLWSLHDQVARQRPKLGEMVTVRASALPRPLPNDVHCDEALIESIVVEQDGRLRYVPEAHVYNFAPAGLGDLYQQRRRIAAQHRALRRLRHYQPSTSDYVLVIPMLASLAMRSGRRVGLVLLLVALEALARAHGWWDDRRGRPYRLWKVARPPSRAAYRLPTLGR